ncbi:MAG TPA: hypothetical protein VLG36_04720 [Candidatus Chromulinivoraceae bacterium]|nr:hypothetical protein [Candidatus Chromulinivoraceae bacterium]
MNQKAADEMIFGILQSIAQRAGGTMVATKGDYRTIEARVAALLRVPMSHNAIGETINGLQKQERIRRIGTDRTSVEVYS